MGLDHPSELGPDRMFKRVAEGQVKRFDEIYPLIEPGQLLEGAAPPRFQHVWDVASPERFHTAIDRRSQPAG